MSSELQGLLSILLFVFAIVFFIALIRALLGVNTTHSKLDEILREIKAIKGRDQKPDDDSSSSTEDASGDRREV